MWVKWEYAAGVTSLRPYNIIIIIVVVIVIIVVVVTIVVVIIIVVIVKIIVIITIGYLFTYIKLECHSKLWWYESDNKKQTKTDTVCTWGYFIKIGAVPVQSVTPAIPDSFTNDLCRINS